ncbi:4-(cytidine 5'-diphospho)-2-C-methyl-D-erythritol kinase [uncultured Brevundimonas sp.]|uniref:4-(cytidine 5'-diphospho)-2-C-methyl-D-erythritol kinase n=1 Tax=uncultured Brevundimonas sp. TaxID=213418 RepID=UPI0030EF437D
MRRDALAPAKVNLFLHVGPLDRDGYHPLASLVAFADLGDRLRVAPAGSPPLAVTGPFAGALAGEGDNLVLRALRGLDAALPLVLDKQLPVAAGLGGGSADAGAALRLARRVLARDQDDATLLAVAGNIGADGPMCLFARPVWAEGRGDRMTPEPALPPLAAVLVNPGVPSPTGAVYRAYDAGPAAAVDRPAPPADWRVTTVIDWLGRQRNDLQAPAVALCPPIGAALEAVAATPGVRLARMSGSGATVFGLCADAVTARAAAAALSAAHPDWWVRATVLGHGLDPDDH